MKIRCPNCGRLGYLPDHLVSTANSLRCRKCQGNFMMPELSLQGVEPRLKEMDSWRGTTVDTPMTGRSREKPALFLADGFVASFDEPELPLRKLGPGDSHYELTFSLKDEPSPSGDDWAAADADDLEPEAPSSDEIEALVPTIAPLSRLSFLTYGFIMSWIRPLCIVSLGFVAISVVVIGFLLVRSLELGGGPVLSTATHALVLASLGTVGFLLFGLWVVFLSLVLTDVTQNLRRLRDPEDRERER